MQPSRPPTGQPMGFAPPGQQQQLQIQTQLPVTAAGQAMTSMVSTPSALNFQTKKGRMHNWNILHRQNKKLNNEMQLKNYDLRKESRSYLLTIKGVQGISHQEVMSQGGNNQMPMAGAKYSLEYYLTLYNREMGTQGGFYGRTYRTQAQAMRESAGSWDLNQEEFIYFHTNYVEKTSFIAIECVIVRDIAGLKTYSSAGFALCDVFQFKGQDVVDLTKGSPRTIGILGLEAVSKGQRSGGRLTYELRDYPQFDKIKQLIPQNCFCGMEDVIPGLVNDKIPHPRQGGATLGKTIDIPLLPRATLYIHNIQMLTSIAFESRFENFLRRMKQEKLRNAKGLYPQIHGNTTDTVYIDERRIMVSANNTWKNITDDSYVSMSPPNEQGISQSGGTLQIKNFICHPLVALIIRIEYKAIIPIGQRNEQVFFNLGYVLHLPTFNAAGELSEDMMDARFTLGPGSTPNGDLVWDPNAEDTQYYQVRMKAFISTSASPPVGMMSGYEPQTAMRPMPQKQMFAGQQAQHGAPGNMNLPPTIDPQVQKALSHKDQQLKDLEQKYQELRAREAGMQQHAENLEMRQLQQMQYPNQQQRDPYAQQNMKQVSMEKQMLESQLNQMKTDMRQYMDSIQEAQGGYQQQQYLQQQQYMNNPYQMMQMNQIGQQIAQPLSSTSQAHIASIGNVFYNMLNLLGEKEHDKRIIGLSSELKQLMQTTRHDDLLAPKAPYVGLSKVNLLKTTDLPLSDQVNFIKHGLGDILKHPSANVRSDGIEKDKLTLQIESQDNLRASTITFKFICFKTPWNGMDQLPRKFYFHFKFFTFPPVKTAPVQIKNPHEHATNSTDGQGIKAGYPYYLTRVVPQLMQGNRNPNDPENRDNTMHDPNLLAVTFNVDPSISRIRDEHERLSSYMYDRFLTVDIFDAESQFLYGTCKIPLFELLRQGRGSVVRAKECEMCDPDTGDFRGAVQMIMSNVGHTPSVTVEDVSDKNKSLSPEKKRVQPSQSATAPGTESGKCKKIVKSKPMDLTQIQQTNNPASAISANVNHATQTLLSQMTEEQITHVSNNNADLRKKLRVDRVRKMTMGSQQAKGGMNLSSVASVEDPQQPDWLKMKSLREIEMIRATKKEHILNRVMEEYVSGGEQLSVVPGSLSFVKLKIHNGFNSREVYTIHINDPDQKSLHEKELQLVTDKVEWRYWVSQGKCSKPPSFDVLTEQGDVILQPNEEVELLFKFLTLREVQLLPDSVHQAPEMFIKTRKIQIITMQSNRQPYSNLEVQVVPSSAPIDHTFRFNEPQNSHVTISIPPFIQLNHLGIHAVLSKPTAVVDINKHTGFINIQTKTDEENTISTMTLFIYGDQYKENLLATCQIEVHSLVTIYTKIKAGLQSIQSLSLPAENARSVMIHSSSPQLVYLPKRENNRTFRVIPHTINHIQVCAKTYLPVQQKVKINCTDINTGELVHSWLMIIDADQPTITKTHEVFVKANHVSVQSLEFVSRLNLKAVFEFASSDENLVVPKSKALAFEPKECKMIDLHFPAQPKFGAHQAYLFANDIDHNVVECFLLNILCVQ